MKHKSFSIIFIPFEVSNIFFEVITSLKNLMKALELFPKKKDVGLCHMVFCSKGLKL